MGYQSTFIFMRTRRTATLQPFAAIPQYPFTVLSIIDIPIGGGGGGGGGLSSIKRSSHVDAVNGNRMRTRMEC